MSGYPNQSKFDGTKIDSKMYITCIAALLMYPWITYQQSKLFRDIPIKDNVLEIVKVMKLEFLTSPINLGLKKKLHTNKTSIITSSSNVYITCEILQHREFIKHSGAT